MTEIEQILIELEKCHLGHSEFNKQLTSLMKREEYNMGHSDGVCMGITFAINTIKEFLKKKACK